MSNDNDSNTISNIVTIGAVALGWVLGETTGWLKKKWSLRVLKKALIIEIEDCLSWLKRNQLTIEHMLQLTVLSKLPDFVPVDVPTHIYDTHFPEVSPNISRSERISFNSIHNLIRVLRRDIIRLVELRSSCITDKSRLREFTEVLEASYHNISMAIWQIQYHLANSKNLNIDKLTGEDALKIEKDIEKKIKDLISEAKEIGPIKVNEKYYKT